jgi:hypothetical protein
MQAEMQAKREMFDGVLGVPGYMTIKIDGFHPKLGVCQDTREGLIEAIDYGLSCVSMDCKIRGNSIRSALTSPCYMAKAKDFSLKMDNLRKEFIEKCKDKETFGEVFSLLEELGFRVVV